MPGSRTHAGAACSCQCARKSIAIWPGSFIESWIVVSRKSIAEAFPYVGNAGSRIAVNAVYGRLSAGIWGIIKLLRGSA